MPKSSASGPRGSKLSARSGGTGPPRSKGRGQDIEVNLSTPGRDLESKPVRQDLRIVGGLVIFGAIVLFLIFAAGLGLVTWIVMLQDAEAVNKLQSLQPILYVILSTLGAALTSLGVYLFRRRR